MRFGLQLRSLLLLLALGSACLAFGQAPTITSLSPSRQAVLAGQPLTLSVAATGAAPLTYQWRRNGLPIEGATSATYTLTAATSLQHTGWYQVVVTSSTGSTRSEPIHVNVATSPALVFELGRHTPLEGPVVAQPAAQLVSVARIAAGHEHSLALTHQGTVLAWGRDISGQLNVPADLRDVVDIAAGAQHSLALRADGRVVAWGNNTEGQTDVPASLGRVVRIAAGSYHNLALRADGTVVAWGANAAGQCNVPRTLIDVVAIAAGGHSIALRADGTLLGWGSNEELAGWEPSALGQRPMPAGLNGVVDVVAKNGYTLALRADGSVVGWGGHPTLGPIAVPAGLSSVAALATSTYTSFAIKNDGSVVSWDTSAIATNRLEIPSGLAPVSAGAAGTYHALFLRRDNGETAPGISASPRSVAESPGREVTLSVVASGGPHGYQWRRNGVAIERETGSTITFVVSENTVGNYDVIVTNSKGSTTSDPAAVSIAPGPRFQIQPSTLNRFPIAGAAFAFEVSVLGEGSIKYQWYRNGHPIAGAEFALFTIARVSTADEGIYHVTATDIRGTTRSVEAPLRIAAAPVITAQPVDVESTPGADVIFTITTAEKTQRFEWRKDGAPATNGVAVGSFTTSGSFFIRNVRLADAGTYQVIAHHPAGSVASRSVSLSFPTLPSIKAVTKSEIVANEGASVVIVASIFSASTALRYQWRLNGQDILNNNTATSPTLRLTNLTEAQAGLYEFVATNQAGTGTGARTTLTVRTRPVLISSPANVTAASGQQVTLSVSARNAETYLWRKDSVPLLDNPTATSANLRVSHLAAADAGRYDVIVENQAGHVISPPATLDVTGGTSHLANVSILAQLAADESLTVGLVTGGASTAGAKPLLIRAAGPSLQTLGVQGALPDPKLEFLSGSAVVGSNDNWGASSATALIAAFNDVGAFAYAGPASLDSALHLPAVGRGDYSARVSSANSAGGWVLAEVYDATRPSQFGATTPRIINLSVIKRIEGSLTAGFVVAGTQPKVVLVRALGPALQAFGVAGHMPDPKVELFDAQRASIATNDNWGGAADLAGAFSRSGAFMLDTGSRDAAFLRTLTPGAYTVQVTSANGEPGVGLIEIYEVP